MKLYAYTDESGNSGLKLFGEDQDTFWTGTMISFSDLDQKYASLHRELADGPVKCREEVELSDETPCPVHRVLCDEREVRV